MKGNLFSGEFPYRLLADRAIRVGKFYSDEHGFTLSPVLTADGSMIAILALQKNAARIYGSDENLHSVVTDGAWDRSGNPLPIGWRDPLVLTQLFQHPVLERLSREFAAKLRKWHPSGLQVYCGPPVEWEDKKALERLSASILRPSFAGARLYRMLPRTDRSSIVRLKLFAAPSMPWTGSLS